MLVVKVLLPVIEALTSFGCQVNITNKVDATALHLAARYGHTEIVRYLCLAGLDLTTQDTVSFIFYRPFCF